MKDKKHSKHEDRGGNADVQDGDEALTKGDRALAIGESGQFAPGGYCNQRVVNEPQRRRDDDIVPPARR